MAWIVFVLIVIVVPVLLYVVSRYLDRRTVRRGHRPWKVRRGLSLLDRAGRVAAGNSAQGYISDSKGLGDAYDLDEGKRKQPDDPENLAP